MSDAQDLIVRMKVLRDMMGGISEELDQHGLPECAEQLAGAAGILESWIVGIDAARTN